MSEYHRNVGPAALPPYRISVPARKPVRLDAPRFLPRVFALLLGIVLAVSFVPPVGLAICLALSVYAWKGPKETIEAFTILALLLLLGNSYTSSMGRWLVLFSCFGRAMWDGIIAGASTPRIVRPLLLFSLTITFFAFLISYIPTVSVLKAVTFAMGVGSIMVSYHRTRHLQSYWLSWLFTFGIFILIASFPLYATEYGYRKNGSGFQGILNHPQSYGVVVSPITAFLTGLFLFKKNQSPLVVIGILLGWTGIFASQARTSFIATAGSLAVALAIAGFLGTRWRETIAETFASWRVLLVLLGAVSVALLQWSAIEEGMTRFLLKDDSDESVVASLESSRGALIERSFANFLDEPVTGIGFGVPSDPTQLNVRTGPMGIPLGASVEKGFMPSAVLEETGLIGALLVLYFIFRLMTPVFKRGSMFSLWLIITCLLLNGGEMIFFAIGAGDCVFLWLLMGFCHFYVDSPAGALRSAPPKPPPALWLRIAKA